MIEIKLEKIDVFEKEHNRMKKIISIVVEKEAKLIFNKSLKYLDRQIFFYNLYGYRGDK